MEQLAEPAQDEKKRKREDVDDKCPICLCEYENPGMLDQCFHCFCFLCILQWSQVGTVARCPLCKKEFDSIIYDVRSNREYKRYFINDTHKKESKSLKDNFMRKYHDKFGIKKKLVRTSNEPLSTEHALRRAVYLRGLRAIPFDTQSSSKKPSKSSFPFTAASISKNSSYWETKLKPWIARELQAVLEEEDVELLVVYVLSILQKYDINSQEAKEHLSKILIDYTDTFIHELSCFGNSPYELHTYDKLVRYDYSHSHNSSKSGTSNSNNALSKVNLTEEHFKHKSKEPKRENYHLLKRELIQVDNQIADLTEELTDVTKDLEQHKATLEAKLNNS